MGDSEYPVATIPGRPGTAESVARGALADGLGVRLCERLRVRWFRFQLRDRDPGPYEVVVVQAGRLKTRRVVPPAGEALAFDVEDWTRRIEVYVSPTGRSVRVYVDGVEYRP